MSFSNYFKQLRKEKSISQDELAKILKASNSAIRNIEAGRTKLPRHELFYRLTDYVGGDPIKIAYDIFFENELEEYGHQLREINKLYLANKWNYYFIISPAPHFVYDEKEVLTLDGLYWKPGFPYYRCLLGYFDKKKYLAAINSKDKNVRLREVIYSETVFIDLLENKDHIREIRFVLDKNDSEEKRIFNEIRKLKLYNLGSEVDISFVLFNTKTKKIDQDTDKYYATKKRSRIGI